MCIRDRVVNLPLAEIFETHIQTGADITVVCGNDSFATENGTYFELDHDGWVTDVLYHLHNPRGYRGLEAYIISTQLLKDLVDECFVHDQFSWRRDVLQARKDQLRLHAYVWNGFAAQIRSVQEYYDLSLIHIYHLYQIKTGSGKSTDRRVRQRGICGTIKPQDQ